mmetsp:Transcript_111694/g.296873  ORF Transcript_111694/g.296873 Transcript_111694/m.296873 type:complete len:371 (-) Transcript_111694:289-1401(-)
MPLAHTPFRPRPVVEFLGTRLISAEDAARGLASSVEGDSGELSEVRNEMPGSTLVNFRQIPGIVDALQTDWVGLRSPPACFTEVRGRLETHLHPCFLGEKLALGLRGAAGALLFRFNKTLKCVPLGFTLLLPAGTHGAVVGESPYVHFLVDFRAVGFVPMEKQFLVGRPNEHQTAQGLNVLILNCFNMFVSKRTLPPELRFDAGSQCWVYGEKGHRLRAKRGPIWVKSSTSALDSKGPVPSLFGTLTWPPFVEEFSKRTAPNEEGRNGEAAPSEVPESIDPLELQGAIRMHEKNENKDKRDKKEKKDKKDRKDKMAASVSATSAPGPVGADRGAKKRSGADGPAAVSHAGGVRTDAVVTGVLKRRRGASA